MSKDGAEACAIVIPVCRASGKTGTRKRPSAPMRAQPPIALFPRRCFWVPDSAASRRFRDDNRGGQASFLLADRSYA